MISKYIYWNWTSDIEAELIGGSQKLLARIQQRSSCIGTQHNAWVETVILNDHYEIIMTVRGASIMNEIIINEIFLRDNKHDCCLDRPINEHLT